jgi:hypothetical protein
VTVRGARSRGVLGHAPARKGIAHVLRDTQDRKDACSGHLPQGVIRGRLNWPQRQDQPWSLRTDLEGRAEVLCQLCSHRMSVEQLFFKLKAYLRAAAPRTVDGLIEAVRDPLRAVRPGDILGWFAQSGYRPFPLTGTSNRKLL